MEQESNKAILLRVYAALYEKGYRPIDQLVGYIVTEDPTYITNYGAARQLITRLDRDELLRDIIEHYINDASPTKKE